MSIEFQRVVPVLRIFDISKAREFYLDFLDFKIDWEHRFDDNAPLYMQISRGPLVLHLSEHHGDGTPGSIFRVQMSGVEELHRQILAKKYTYNRPGLETEFGKSVTVIDPFHNQIIFCEPK